MLIMLTRIFSYQNQLTYVTWPLSIWLAKSISAKRSNSFIDCSLWLGSVRLICMGYAVFVCCRLPIVNNRTEKKDIKSSGIYPIKFQSCTLVRSLSRPTCACVCVCVCVCVRKLVRKLIWLCLGRKCDPMDRHLPWKIGRGNAIKCHDVHLQKSL